MWWWHWSFELKQSIKYSMPGSTLLHLAILFYPFFLLKINDSCMKFHKDIFHFNFFAMIYTTWTTYLSDLMTVFRSNFFQIWPRNKLLNYRTRVRSLGMLVSDWLTNWLPNSCLVNLIDLTLAFEDANSILVEVVTVADVDDEHHVGNSLLQIW